jgi:hypothetical protein
MAADSAASAPQSAQQAQDAPRIGAQFPPIVLPAALVSGVIASAAFDMTRDSLLILSIAVLVAGAWWVLWRSIADTRWAEIFSSWPLWRMGEPITALPYTQAGSLADKAAIKLGFFRHWLRHELLPQQATGLFASACALAVALVMSAVLGAQALTITLLFMGTTQLALYLNKGTGNNNRILFNLAMIGLPFALGRVVFKPLTLDIASLSAVVFACAAIFGALRNRNLQNIGLGAAVLLLIVMRHTIGAFFLAALWLPLLLLPGFRAPRWWPLVMLIAGGAALS